MKIDISLLISIISITFAIFTGIASLKRNNNKDIKDQTAEMTSFMIELKYIGTGVDEIKREVKSIKSETRELQDRMIINEQTIKSCHKRLDAFEQKLERID